MAQAWVVTLRQPLSFRFALDGNGDVVLSPTFAAVGTAPTRKLDGETGKVLWTADVMGVPHLDAAGDVYVSTGRGCSPVCQTVTKIDGSTGAVLWENEYFSGGGVGGLAEGSASGVFVRLGSDDTILKLASASGSPLWQRVFAGQAWLDTAVDAAGDLVMARSDPLDDEIVVTKLSGASGATIWTLGSGEFSHFPRVAIDSAGDVLVVASVPDVLLKLDGTDGSQLWRQEPSYGDGVQLVIDPNDDVLVGDGTNFSKLDGTSGVTSWTGTGEAFAALPDGDVMAIGPQGFLRRYEGGTGALSWQQTLLGRTVPLATINDFRLGSRGAYASGGDFFIGLASRLTGKKLLVKDDTNTVAKSQVVLLSKDPLFHPPGLGSPTPPVDGAVLTITNPDTLETGVFTLPAANWTAKETGSFGRYTYAYKDPAGSVPRCKAVLRSPGKLKVKCVGGLGGLTLDESSQGGLQVRFSVGTGGHDYCLEFGGDVTLDVGTGTTGTGIFKARNAPPPDTCLPGF